MNVAILGYGTVGSGVFNIISNAHTEYTKAFKIVHILVRENKKQDLPCMCSNYSLILNDPKCDVIVETIGGIEPAYTYIMQALMHKKHVVTANKAVVALHLQEFHDCAKKNHVVFAYEATTGGGIPWIESLKKAMRIDEITKIHGIFNGTSNYILDHMQRFGTDFAQTLLEAQKLGYAESDPSADIEGIDISNKLVISASLAYHYHIPQTFPTFGIANITKEDVAYFNELNLVVRLIAISKRAGNKYSCVVEPILFKKADLEANIKDNYNFCCLNGYTIQDLKFYGQGAGKLATANAIVQDLIDLKNNDVATISWNNNMVYDPSICQRDYIIRTSIQPADLSDLFKDCEYEINEKKPNFYVHIKNIEVFVMHGYMKQLLSLDPHAFMASINKEE